LRLGRRSRPSRPSRCSRGTLVRGNGIAGTRLSAAAAAAATAAAAAAAAIAPQPDARGARPCAAATHSA